MTPAELARRRRAPKGEGDKLRGQILDAASELLLASGSVESVSIRAVADRVGVTPPSIYRHFADKNELVYAVCMASYNGLAADIEAAIVVDDPIATLMAQAKAYVHYGLGHPEHYRLMFMTQEDQTPEDLFAEMTADGSAFALLLETVEQVIEAGLVRAAFSELGAAAVGIHLWSIVHGITSLHIAKPSLPVDDIDEFVDQQLDIIMTGISSTGCC